MKKESPSAKFTAIVLSVGLSGFSYAALIHYEASGVFTSSDFPTSVAVGDHFICTLTYDDSTIDSSSDTNSGFFLGAVHAYSFSLDQGAVGVYGGGSIQFPHSLRISTAGNLHSVYVFSNANFGTIDGENVGAQFYLIDYTHSTSMDVSGTGRSLSNSIGGTLDLNQFPDSRMTISAGKSSATATFTSLRVVPEPSCLFLCSASLALLLQRKRIRQPINKGCREVVAIAETSSAPFG
jgi:hypothetical protein